MTAGLDINGRFEDNFERRETIVKLINETISPDRNISVYKIRDIVLPDNGNYQLVFYVGMSEGTICINYVGLSVQR